MKKIRRLLSKYQDVFFPIFDVLLNGFNFFMHIYISWFITLNAYSVLNAALSLLAIMFVVGISIQTYTTRELSKTTKVSETAALIFRSLGVILISMNVLLFMCTPLLTKYIRSDIVSIFIIILIFDVNVVLSYYRGIMQSQKMFFDLNKSFYIEVLTKMVLIIGILPFVRGSQVPLLGILVGMILSLYHGIHLIKKRSLNPLKHKMARKISKEIQRVLFSVFHIMSSNFFLYYLTSINLIVANYFIGEKAGIYAVSLKFSQLIMAVGFSVITVLAAYASELVMDIDAFTRYVRKWLFRFILGGAVILLGYKIVVVHLITFLFGPIYAEAKNYIVLQGFGYVLLAIGYFCNSILIIQNRKIQIYLLMAVSIILTIGLFFNHSTILHIIYVEVVSFTILGVSLIVSVLHKEGKNAVIK